MANQRRHYSPEEKVKILRFHLLENKPVSELCDQHGIHPTLFYQWQRAFFENGAAAFANRPHSRLVGGDKKTIQTLEDKLKRKNEVLSEVMEEMLRLKKELGES
jgi:transposase